MESALWVTVAVGRGQFRNPGKSTSAIGRQFQRTGVEQQTERTQCVLYWTVDCNWELARDPLWIVITRKNFKQRVSNKSSCQFKPKCLFISQTTTRSWQYERLIRHNSWSILFISYAQTIIDLSSIILILLSSNVILNYPSCHLPRSFLITSLKTWGSIKWVPQARSPQVKQPFPSSTKICNV
jgi:hypothetical protein